MRGHVRSAARDWTVVYDERADENGKRRQRSKGGFATRREAQRFLTEQARRLGDGTYAAPSKVTVGEYSTTSGCPPWRARCGRSASPRTPPSSASTSPRHRPLRLQALSGAI